MTTNNTEYDTEYDSQNEVIHCMAQPSANHDGDDDDVELHVLGYRLTH